LGPGCGEHASKQIRKEQFLEKERLFFIAIAFFNEAATLESSSRRGN
jgi:hypothetical protein